MNRLSASSSRPSRGQDHRILGPIDAAALLSLFELVIVIDGATDDTLEVLVREFDLIPFPGPTGTG